MWVGLIQSLEGSPRNRWTSLEQKGILAEACLQTLPWVSSLPAYPTDFGLASLHHHMTQFIKINMSPYPTPDGWMDGWIGR